MKKRIVKILIVSIVGLFCIGGILLFRSSILKKNKVSNNDDKKMKISWTAYQNAPTDPNGEMIKYYENKFNVDLNVWNLDYDKYEEQLDLRLAAGDIPDLFRIQDPNSLAKYASEGVLAEIPIDTIKKYAPNIYNILETNAPGFLNYGKVGGKQYAIPSIYEDNKFRVPIVYRLDWMKKLGVTKTPENLQEFESLMYKFAKDDPDGDGKNDTYGLSADGMSIVFGAFGGVPQADYWIDKGGKPVYTGTMPEMKQALALLHKWYKDGVLDPEFISGENYGGYWPISHAFANGRIGVTTRGNYYHWLKKGDYTIKDAKGDLIQSEPGADTQELLSVNPKAETIFGEPPVGPLGNRGIMQYNRLMNFYAISASAAKDPKKVAKILEILDYISANPDIDVRMTAKYGMEGKDWKWIDKSKDLFTQIGKAAYDFTYPSRIGANLYMDLPFISKEPRAQWAYQNNFDEYGIESIAQAATPAMVRYGDKLKKLREDAYIAIITGEKPVDYFDEFVKEYNAAGGAEVEKEVTAWYNSNKSKN